MIDVTSDDILSLADAARLLPPINGKRPHVSTLWRWSRKGINGVTLEIAQLGGRIVTSREALNRFAAAVAAAQGERFQPQPTRATRTRPNPSRC